MDQKDKERLSKLLELSRSSNDNEALSAIRNANSLLDKNNLRWPSILSQQFQVKYIEITVEPEPSDYIALIDYIKAYSNHEPTLDFINSLESFFEKVGYLTEKQSNALFKCYQRVKGYL